MAGVRFTLMTMQPLDDAAVNGALLDAFEPDFRPTHANADEDARDEYQRDAFLAAIVAARQKLGGEFHTCAVARKKAPKYAGHFWSRGTTMPSYLSLTFDEVAPPQVAPILALGDRLAAVLRVDYGTAHLTFPEATPLYNGSGGTLPKDLPKFGPRPLGARTWLAPHIVGLIGRDRLDASGVHATSTPWGALRIDLLDDLARQPMAALQAKQSEVMASLADTGVFAIYQPGTVMKKAPNWKPLP
jgi:hypothetical protein